MFVSALLATMISGQGMAATIRYSNSGDYFATLAAGNVGSNGWQNVAGVPGLPGAADTIRFNWGNNTVTLAGLAPTVTTFQMGVDESGGLVVNNGGSLTTTGNSTIGNNNNGDNPVNGFLTISTGGYVKVGGVLQLGAGVPGGAGSLTGDIDLNGGTLEVGSHLWVGARSNTTGTVDINGGILSILNGNFGLGTINASAPSGGFGFMNVNAGGVLNLFNISAVNSIQSGSVLNISGTGIVNVNGNRLSDMIDYVNANRIKGNGLDGLANVSVVYDGINNRTILTAIPEPNVAGLLGGLGLLALAHRRRN
jgi:hypothetical protein